MNEDYDITIIGAGPSGSACALAFQNSKLKILLIDKDSFPRRKACGDSIPGLAFTAIDYINPEWGNKLRSFSRGVEIHKTTLFGPNEGKITKKWKQFAYNCKRSDFDNFLLNLVRDETEIVIQEKQKIKYLTSDAEKVHCILEDGRTIQSSLVIGCDGANSIVKRDLLPKAEHGRNNSAFAVSSYFTGVAGILSDQNEMLYIKKYPNGYFWIFPVENGISNVGFGILSSNKMSKKLNIASAFKDIIASDPNIAPRFKSAKMLDQIKGAPLPFGGKKRKISGNRFMLCGDSASLINPLSGAGIDNATWSGILAAEQAERCFSSSSFNSNAMMEYDKAIRQKCGKKLQRNHRIMRLAIQHPWIVSTIFKLFS